jgi:squalene-associated FAD-dependent desaturase
MRQGVVHVVGAGLAGLAAAVRLAQAGIQSVVHEAAAHAGGRCRSYFDAAMGMRIDNGNHIVLSGNHAALAYLKCIGAGEALRGPDHAVFDFVDLTANERWRLKPSDGPIPWWIFDARRRIPATKARDFLGPMRLLWAGEEERVSDRMACNGPLYERLWRPLLLAALNTEPHEASAVLAGAVLRESLAKGGRACRPLVASQGLSEAFVDPAVRFLSEKGSSIHYGERLKSMGFEKHVVAQLNFGDAVSEVSEDDGVILAVPPVVAGALVPDLQTPVAQRAIVNAHFRVEPPAGQAPIIGVINGTVEWVFSFPHHISITVSAADRLLDVARETLAATLWEEVAAVTGIGGALPPWQIIKERRATFAALPSENARRPPCATQWNNLMLAGDWTQTGLPGTIEGAIRSGNRAAERWIERARG